MKKALALVLCVLMLSTSLVFSTSAAVAADYDWRKVIYDAGYGTIVPNVVATAPVIDGVVNEGEYTKTDVFTAEDSSLLQLDFNAKGLVSLSLSYAHDLQYVYVAVQQETTGGQWTAQFLNLQLGARNKDQGLSKDVWANRRDMTNNFNDDGTPVIAYDANGKPQVAANKDTAGATNTKSLFYYGPEFEYGKDVEAKLAFSNDNKLRTQEYKFAKDYLKRLNITINPTDDPDQEFLAIQWLVNSQYGTYHPATSADMRNAATAAGDDGSAGWFAWPVYFIDYNFAENQMNDGAALFAGPKLAPENAPVIDGKISEGEYYSSKTFTSGNLPAFFGEQATLNSADVKQVTYHVAQDGENVYIALEVEKNAAPKVKRYDRFQFQYGMANEANQKADTNFLSRDIPQITFDDANGQGAVYYSNNAIYDEATGKSSPGNVWERDFSKIKYASVLEAWAGAATEDYRITVYEYKINFERLASLYAHWGAPALLDKVIYKDFLALAVVYNKTNTATKDWADVGNWLWYKPSLNTKAAMDYMNDVRADNGQQATWGMLPIFLFAENGVSTQETASVRISGVNDGLRFKTTVSKFEIQELVNKYGYADVQVGTLIAPTDKLDGALTHESGTAGVDYLDIKADIANPFAATNMAYTFAGSITNIKKENLDRDFTAVGYIAYTNAAGETTYIYSTSAATRNVSEIATAALADETANYTEAQKTILGNLVVAK